MPTSVEFDHSIGFTPVPGGLHFHPNGREYIYCAGGSVMVASLTDPREQEFLRKHDAVLTACRLSPSGNYIASGQGGDNSNVYVWNYSTREIIYSLEEHDHQVQDVSFSHDERLLVTLGNSEDKKMIVWDMSTGYIIAANSKMPAGTICIAHGGFMKDIKRRETQNYQFCTGGSDGILYWNLDPYSGELLVEKFQYDSRTSLSRTITSICFYDNNENICASTTAGDYLIANIRNKHIIKNIPATNLGLGSILAFEKGIILGGGDSSIKFFDHNQRMRSQVRVDGAVIAMSFSPDKLEVIAGTVNGTIVRLNLDTMQFITLSESHTHSITAVTFAQDSNDKFATTSNDGTIRIWDAAECMVVLTARARPTQVANAVPQCLVYTHVLLSGWSDGKILAHCADTGEHLWDIDAAHPGGVTAICESNNSRFILSGGQNGEVRLWELRSRDLISNLKEHNQRITSLAVFEDDTQALSSSRDKCILRWDLRSERRQFCHTQRMGGINCIALAADQRTIVSVGQERRLTFWDVATPGPVQVQAIDGEHDEALSVVLSHDGRLIATGGSAGMLSVWGYESGEQIFRGISHTGNINSIAFSPDDKQVDLVTYCRIYYRHWQIDVEIGLRGDHSSTVNELVEKLLTAFGPGDVSTALTGRAFHGKTSSATAPSY
eukprot:gene6524-13197_t